MKLLILSNPESGKTRSAVPARFQTMIEALKKGGIDAVHHFVNTPQDVKNLIQQTNPDIVFSSAYYVSEKSNQINIQSLLGSLNIPSIGSDKKSLELVISKQALKKKWIADGITTPCSTILRLKLSPHYFSTEQLDRLTKYPYILKPNREGNSRGIDSSSIIRDKVAFRYKAVEMTQKYGEVLVERYLGDFGDIREYTVAMIGGNNHMLVMPAEIILTTKIVPRLVSRADKDQHRTKAVEIGDPEVKRTVSNLARKAFESSGVCDYSRCDILYADSTYFAIEINGLPMLPDLWFQNCARYSGLDEIQYINAVVSAGIARNIKKGKLNLPIPTQMQKLIPAEIFQIICTDYKQTCFSNSVFMA